MQTLRYPIVLVTMVLAVHAPDLWRGLRASPTQGRPGGDADRVVLVVSDGLRWQEVFRGADSLLVFGDARALGGDPASVRSRYWRPTVAERRATLMPFLWGTIASQGQVFGNRDAGSAARVTNPMKFSYPGYNEMLVGYPDPRIDRNDYGPNPNVTVFEWLHRRGEFERRVAVVGTWSAFHDIFNARRSRLAVTTRNRDAETHAAAMAALRAMDARALFVGYGETDDWAHKGRYDRTLDAAHAVDGWLAELWSALQSTPAYRGRTTLIVVADHGRGRTPRDWTDHGRDVDGSDETWLAVIGPHTAPAGVHGDGVDVTLAQTAATVAAALGLDYAADARRAAAAITAAVRK